MMIETWRKFLKESANSDVWYHGSNCKIDKFKTFHKQSFGPDVQEVPIFVTKSLSFAKAYGNCKGGKVYKCRLSPNLKIFSGSQLFETDCKYWPPEVECLSELGLKLLKDLESGNVFEHCKDDEHESLQAIADISQHFYSTVEDSRFTKWLRENEFDGCFTREGTSEPMEENAFIFNPENIEIIENQI